MATKARKLDATLYGSSENGTKLYAGDMELLGTWEVARYLGIEKSRIARWLKELAAGETPIEAPVARLKCGPLWTRAQVEAKLKAMYSEADSPYGKTEKGLRTWVQERRDRRE